MSNNSTKESPLKDESILDKLDAATLEKMPLVASLAEYYGHEIKSEVITLQEDYNFVKETTYGVGYAELLKDQKEL